MLFLHRIRGHRLSSADDSEILSNQSDRLQDDLWNLTILLETLPICRSLSLTSSDETYTVGGASFSQTDFFRSLINSPEIASIIEAIEAVNSEELSAELFRFLNHTEKDVADTDAGSTVEMWIYEENSNDIVIPAGSIKNYFNQLMESGSAERPFELNEKFTSRYYFFSEPYFGTDFISWSKKEDRSGINESVYVPSGPLEGEYSLT